MLLAVSKATGQRCACIPNIASGLGGGMAIGEACGAVTGGVMVIGLVFGQEGKETVKAMTKEFVHRFDERNGAVRCKDILGLDLNSEEAPQEYRARNLKTTCNGLVSGAVEVLMDIIEKSES